MKENFQPQDGIRGDPIANLMAQIMEVDIGPQDNIPEIPRYHDEYKKAFPKDVDFYNRLRLNWTQAQILLDDSGVQADITWIRSTATISGQIWRQYEGPQMAF